MLRILLTAAMLAVPAPSWADGPGSRIRAGPEPPQPAGLEAGPTDRDLQRCEALPGDLRRRCLRGLRAALREPERSPHQGPGPESTGAGSGAGTGASTGTSGAGTFGASAPR